MRKIVFWSLELVLLAAFGASAQINVSLLKENTLVQGWVYSPAKIEVGFSVKPQLELVGNLAYESSTEPSWNSWSFIPGIGARYFLLAEDRFSAYGFGSVNYLFTNDAGYRKTGLDFGLGVAYRLDESCGVFGEFGARGFFQHYEESEYYNETKDSGLVTYNNLGLRFYL